MAGLVPPRASRLPSYSRSMLASLRLAAVLALALATSGCAVSGQLGSLFSKSKKPQEARAYAEADDDVVTGSVGPAKRAAAALPAALPPESDLVYARAVVVEVLARGSRDVSAPWENPRSGARGTVTPIATAYNQDGDTCRDFLASYLRAGAETWMQGEACRPKKGQWEVKSLRPWKRS
jgi:surface antigen